MRHKFGLILLCLLAGSVLPVDKCIPAEGSDQAQKLNISFQNFSIPREAISFMYSGIGISDNFS